MANVAPVEDGKVVDITNSSSTKKESSSALGKDDFLQLLVAQMKYQDPMEPTSNTEYIQQYATYSELEQMMNMSESMDLQRASGLVGQTVHVDYETATGEDKSVEGVVDFVYYENGTPFVSIGGEKYKAEDVTYVYDATYVAAITAAKEWTDAMDKLPALEDITIKDYDTVANLFTEYSKYSDYTKSFIDDKYEEVLTKYVEKVVALKGDDTTTDGDTTTGGTEGGEGTEGSEGTGSTEGTEGSTTA